MTAKPNINEERTVIPRWRHSLTTPFRWELRGDPHRSKRPVPNNLTQKIAEWHTAPSIETATEVLQGCIVSRRPYEAFGAAEFIIKAGEKASIAARTVASAVRYPSLASVDNTSIEDAERQQSVTHAQIRNMKRRLIEGPRDSLGWSDLALLYAAIGQHDKASQAIDRALATGRQDRTILRSAVRFYVHEDDADRALHLLRRSDHVKHDPWLLSPEIALSMMLRRPPKFIKEAKEMVERFDKEPGYVTELCSSLASHELHHKSFKFARRFFRTSLVDPNDNVLAQAIWANHVSKDIAQLDDKTLHRPASYEANAMSSFWSRDWSNAQHVCRKWALDEIFSPRPVQLASYIGCAITNDYKFARDIARLGLIANPLDALLRNNLIVAETKLGNLGEALAQLAHLPKQLSDTELTCTMIATRGLVAFALGDLELGRQYYQSAHNVVRNILKLRKVECVLLVHYAEQEMAYGEPARAVEILSEHRLLESAKALKNTPDLEFMLARLTNDIQHFLQTGISVARQQLSLHL